MRPPALGDVGARARTTSQTAVIYDHFTPFVLPQLEEFGFCGRGEAKDFIRDGNIELGGRLPINTHGGQLGEAYLHGMNGIAEGVRQVRGTVGEPGRRRRATCSSPAAPASRPARSVVGREGQLMGRLEGRVAVVTGGGDGIGRGICRRFAAEGAKVLVAELHERHRAKPPPTS